MVGGKVVESEGVVFDQAKLEELRQRQIQAVQYLDTVIEELFDMVPENTWITVTSDHGEVFGEDGYFGHGPVHHDKVYEVPFIEGKLR
jgi:arylsulfatase A-like enzyme